MKTPIESHDPATRERVLEACERFPHALRLPLVAAPMFLVSSPDLVIGACRAGIVGAFPTPNARPVSELENWMRRIVDALARSRAEQPGVPLGPWAANLVTHSSNARLVEDLALVAKYRPPIVITALGSPRPAIEVVHGYGGLVFGDVVNLTLAKKAVDAGVDGLACVCSGAGGHTGSISPFAFVSAVREFFDGIVVLGGGIADGWGVAGAIAAGADLVYMGTRFIAAEESLAPVRYKAMLASSTVDDVIVSAGLTGTPAMWLKPSLRENGFDPENMPVAPERNYNSNRDISRWRDIWAAGQGVGAVKRVTPVAQIVDDIEREYRQASARFALLAPVRRKEAN
jgi:nitronate monooxygenase